MADNVSDELRLALLGGLHITAGGRGLAGLTSHKARALLCYLACTGRPHSRDALTALLWSDVPESEARTSLRPCFRATQSGRPLPGDHPR